MDYKQKFPKELEKSICAFANSYGGIIIIGVRTDDGKPVPPYEGVPYRKGLEETVWQIITIKIWPPIFPQIRVCPPKNGRTFIVIRVPQSEITPHAVLNKWVYVQVGNITDIATTEKIEWLKDRREKSEQSRKMLCRRADDRFNNIFKDYLSGLLDFKISSIPLYPQRPFVEVEKIEEIADTHYTKDGISIKFRYLPEGYPKDFPWNRFDMVISKFQEHIEPEFRDQKAEYRRVQDGIVFWYIDHEYVFTELNCFGLYYWRSLRDKTQTLPLDWFVCRLKAALLSMHKFYQKIGYFGPVKVDFLLKGIMGIKFWAISKEKDSIKHGEKENKIEDNIAISYIKNTYELGKDKAILELAKKVYWACGFVLPEEVLDECKVKG